ncbi:hypothetical protein [Pseudoroseicyclus sp. CXY001]|uniref:hypothetical protein n=1 Tax=Pseudoroseicyclus sp. CXY001 TaxID=3242492 RepID=UPI00358DD93D
MTSFTVYQDRIDFDDRQGKRSASAEALPLSMFRTLLSEFSKYPYYFGAFERVFMQQTTDYESGFEDAYGFVLNGASGYDPDAEGHIRVVFKGDQMKRGDFDYMAMAAPDTSTAYKRGRRIAPEETYFKIERAFCKSDEDRPLEWFREQIERVVSVAERLDRATASLESWAASGMSMRAVCAQSIFCSRRYGEADVISHERLSGYAQKGWSLDEFKSRLTCRRCGSPAGRLVPMSRLRPAEAEGSPGGGSGR